MPNHVTNTVVIYSDKEGELERILAEIKGECDVIDFAAIVPEPDNLFKDNLGTKERTHCEIMGIPNWYDWNCENWGTKWNAYDQSIIDGPDGEQVTIRFDTAWAAPLPVIAALKVKYPNVEIYGSWLEEGHQSAGTF